MDNNILGNRIREARGDLSLREFAKKCDISHTHLDSLEKGADPRTGKEVSVGWETLRKLSIATGLSIHYLTGDTNDKAGGLVFYPDGSKRETPFTKITDDSSYSDEIKALQLKGALTLQQEFERLGLSEKGKDLTDEQLSVLLDYIEKNADFIRARMNEPKD